MVADITISIVLMISGAIAFIVMKRNKTINELVGEFTDRYTYARSSYSTVKSTYDNLGMNTIERIVNRMSTNFRILIAVYGVLLAFVASDKIALAFTSWTIVVWCGWILATILRAGQYSMLLSDIMETGSHQEVRQTVFGAKRFFRHSLYLLVVAIAFLPSFFLTQPPSEELLLKLPWSLEGAIALVAFSIFVTFIFFYKFIMSASNFITFRGPFDMYMFAVGTISIVSVAYTKNSPLEVVTVSLLWMYQYTIPSVFQIILVLGYNAGVILLIILAQALFMFFKKRRGK